MGKIAAKQYKPNTKNISKHASSTDHTEPTAKERVEAELRLLKARGQGLKEKMPLHKVKKVTVKKGVSVKKQKKLARALLVAEKEEVRKEKASVKLEKRKARKNVWA
ncbi:hypothetical protein DFQ28_005086 [Apophysomyces sp. BC1034]|nr:hypothetical protein DFQ30_010427 [Apophysomyces sp. BC1015]KAG0181842.1 hypothetical protein DFQ29_006768 [Apophysomyces sp. BC1021]KAG0193482.1 hypothetical protein DFQ28_005086 [Apophysomyces sp. BC1034]